MTDETTETEVTQEAEETAQETSSGHLTLSGLNDKIDNLADLIRSKLTGSPRASRADQSAEVAEQVKSEVGKLKAAEDAERRRSGLRSEVDALKDQVKKLSETAPVEYRKVTQWLWGDR